MSTSLLLKRSQIIGTLYSSLVPLVCVTYVTSLLLDGDGIVFTTLVRLLVTLGSLVLSGDIVILTEILLNVALTSKLYTDVISRAPINKKPNKITVELKGGAI